MIPALVPSSFNMVLVRLDGSTVCLEVQGAAAVGHCPACRAASEHIHDRYTRRPLDLPWRGRVVRLQVTVRRFRGENPTSSRKRIVSWSSPRRSAQS